MKSLILIFIFLSFSCKETPAAMPSEDSTETKSVYKEGAKTFVIGKVKMSASENVYKMPGAPKPKALEKCVQEQLQKTASFKDKKGNTVNLRITYDVLEEKSKSIVLLAELRETGEGGRLFSVGNRTQSKGEGLTKMGEEACKNLVTKLTNSMEVSTASDAELIALLSSTASSPSILKNTIQNIREKNVKSASPQLAVLLKHKDTNVAVAAAASLAKFQYTEARLGMLTLAEELSRNKNSSYLPMIYILADIGGAEINEYLKIISTSHEIPRVREVAKKAIEKAKQKKNSKK